MESSYMAFVESGIANVGMNVMSVMGIVTALVLSVLMVINGCVHRKVLKKPDSELAQYPRIALILPCKGVQHNSRDVWDSQIHSSYKGKMDLIFVTESEKDPAYAPLKELVEKTCYKDRTAMLISAGVSWYNSQKVHNMLAGIRAVRKEVEYIFFLDNDIIVNGRAFNNIVQCLQQDEETMCSTGYSIEIPDSHGSIGSYMVSAFRSIQLIGFMSEKTNFLWGGCYMVRRNYLFDNLDNYMDMLRDGTYTEDMVFASVLSSKSKAISASHTALFPNVLPKDYPFAEYLRYLRRQYFLFCTYQSGYHLMNNILQSITMALSFIPFGVPAVCWLVQFVTLIPYLALRLSGYVSSNSSDNGNGGGSGVSPFVNIGLMIGFIVSVFIAGSSISYSVHSLDKMAATLSAKQPHKVPNPFKMGLAISLHLMIMPFVAVIAPLLKNVVWSGIKYVAKEGKVYRMYRKDKDGAFTVTEDPYGSMYNAVREDLKAGMATLKAFPGVKEEDSYADESTALCPK